MVGSFQLAKTDKGSHKETKASRDEKMRESFMMLLVLEMFCSKSTFFFLYVGIND